jgi:hypothetical protein
MSCNFDELPTGVPSRAASRQQLNTRIQLITRKVISEFEPDKPLKVDVCRCSQWAVIAESEHCNMFGRL